MILSAAVGFLLEFFSDCYGMKNQSSRDIMKPFLEYVNHLNYIDIIYQLPSNLLETSQLTKEILCVALLCYKKCFRLKKFYYFMNKFMKIFIQFRYEIHHPRGSEAMSSHSLCCHWYLVCGGWFWRGWKIRVASRLQQSTISSHSFHDFWALSNFKMKMENILSAREDFSEENCYRLPPDLIPMELFTVISSTLE